MGIVMSAFAISSTLGVPFSLYISNLYDWHAPFLIAGGIGVVILPFLFFLVPPMRDHMDREEENKLEVITQILKDKSQYLALLFSAGMMIGHFMIIPFLNPFLEFNLGFDKQTTPLIYLFGGISAFISSFVIGKISDKYGKFKTYVICVILAFPCMIFITHIEEINLVLLLVVVSFWFFVSTGRALSAQALLSNVGKQEFRGSFQSFNSFMQQLGIGTASMLAGVIIYTDETQAIFNYNILGYIGVGVLAATLGIGFTIFKFNEET